jgi:hypothetical protein
MIIVKIGNEKLRALTSPSKRQFNNLFIFLIDRLLRILKFRSVIYSLFDIIFGLFITGADCLTSGTSIPTIERLNRDIFYRTLTYSLFYHLRANTVGITDKMFVANN